MLWNQSHPGLERSLVGRTLGETWPNPFPHQPSLLLAPPVLLLQASMLVSRDVLLLLPPEPKLLSPAQGQVARWGPP